MNLVTEADLARRTTRFELAKRVLIIFTAIAVTACFTVLLALASQGAQRAKDNRVILETIQSCTKPTGGCYKQGQRRTAEAVANINRVVILAAACASQQPGQSVAVIQACVIDRLAAANQKH